MKNYTTEIRTRAQEMIQSVGATEVGCRLDAGLVTGPTYTRFLQQTLLYVRCTEPYLRLAADRLDELGRLPEVAELMRTKAREEAGHDRWITNDLRTLTQSGLDIASEPLPAPGVARYINYHREVVRGHHPEGFLGAAYALEALAAQKASQAASNLSKTTRKPVRFLAGHGEEDPGHVEKLEEVITELPEDSLRAILDSTSITAGCYLGMLDFVWNSGRERGVQAR